MSKPQVNYDHYLKLIATDFKDITRKREELFMYNYLTGQISKYENEIEELEDTIKYDCNNERKEILKKTLSKRYCKLNQCRHRLITFILGNSGNELLDSYISNKLNKVLTLHSVNNELMRRLNLSEVSHKWCLKIITPIQYHRLRMYDTTGSWNVSSPNDINNEWLLFMRELDYPNTLDISNWLPKPNEILPPGSYGIEFNIISKSP